MHYFLEIPRKNNLFVGEIGHGVQQWYTVYGFAVLNALRSVMLHFLGLVLHTQTYAGGFPTPHWPFTQPRFPALALSVGLHLQHSVHQGWLLPPGKNCSSGWCLA